MDAWAGQCRGSQSYSSNHELLSSGYGGDSTAWLDKITLRLLATQTAGFEKPGGFGRLLFEPGTKWHYNDGTLANVPRDAYWTWGLYDSLILVIPSLDIVVARAGQSWPRHKNAGHFDVLKPFFEPICAAASTPSRREASGFPVPPSIAHNAAGVINRPLIIFETDVGSDLDDAGAQSLLRSPA